MTDRPPIERLRAVMARLRNPEAGCPWDREQSFATIAPYTVEEAYEVADAIARADWTGLREELGDLLFQVVFHARMAEEAGLFDFDDVVDTLIDKMVRRHPHVFGGESVAGAAAQTARWEDHKAVERRTGGSRGALAGVPLALPALMRAAKLQRRAARVGFDWPDGTDAATRIAPVLAKIEEEIAEIEAALAAGGERVGDEVGDLLFACVNLARRLDVDPEAALAGTNRRFERRFAHIEAVLAASGRTPEGATLAELEALWQRAKREEGEEGGSAR